MQDSLDVGDEIITAGGLHGTVKEFEDDTVPVEIAPGVVATLDRRAVAAVAREVEVEVEPDRGEDREAAKPRPLAERTRLTYPARVVPPLPSRPGRPHRARARGHGAARRPGLAVPPRR